MHPTATESRIRSTDYFFSIILHNFFRREYTKCEFQEDEIGHEEFRGAQRAF